MKPPSPALKEQYQDASNYRQRTAVIAQFRTNRSSWHRWVFDQFDLTRVNAILELGCGPGTLWKQNLDRTPATSTIVLSDFSAGMLRDCARNLGNHVSRFRFCQLDGSALPFRDHSFSIVTANLMLYHLPDHASALRDIRRVLAPHGTLYAATIGRRHMREAWDAVHSILEIPSLLDAAELFGLETGYEQLKTVFRQVEIRRFEDSLRVTEAQPLVDYFTSIRPYILAPAERLSALREYFERIISQRGEILIPLDTGMFIARN